MIKQWIAGLALLAIAGSASAQDPVAALNNLTANLNTTVNSLLMGDASATTMNLDSTVSTLIMDLSAGTPLASLGGSGVALTHTVSSLALGLTPTIDQITIPLAQAGAPLTEPVIGLTDQLLEGGLLAGGAGGLSLDAIPLSAQSLDASTLSSLTSGQTLPGL